jgi:NAD(P)-dependent dehydrogenase (short-subunit alcohol dehydrogenase family)
MVALITGGASGIGAAAARRLAAQGEHVVIADRAPADSLAAELGGTAVVADVTDPEAVAALVARAEELGPLRTVLLNAGITSGQSGVEDLDLAGYRAIMGVNVDHVIFGTAAAVPALKRAGGGRIVATASLAGLVGMPGDALYTASKHAVVGYVRSAAAALTPHGITINAVCPGFADTPLIAGQKAQFGGFPLLTAENVADAIEAILQRGEPGECWFVQPGRDPAPYGFRGVPGPKNATAPPPLTWN